MVQARVQEMGCLCSLEAASNAIRSALRSKLQSPYLYEVKNGSLFARKSKLSPMLKVAMNPEQRAAALFAASTATQKQLPRSVRYQKAAREHGTYRGLHSDMLRRLKGRLDTSRQVALAEIDRKAAAPYVRYLQA